MTITMMVAPCFIFKNFIVSICYNYLLTKIVLTFLLDMHKMMMCGRDKEIIEFLIPDLR